GFVWGLNTAGQKLVLGRGPAGGVRVRKPWEPSRYFMEHVLAVSELYVQLRQAERDKRLEILSFDAEPKAWRWWHGRSGERLVLKPDAYVVTALGDIEYRTFVERDLATEAGPVIRRKAEAYVRYWQGGAEQQTEGVFPKVIWIVPDERRKQ